MNGLNQYTTAGPASFLYDANGNLRNDGSSAYVYDAENRLVSATGATNASLAYDPLGRLFQVTSGANVTRFLYDGDALVAEYNGAGTMLRRYVHGTGTDEPVLWYEGSNLANRRSLYRDHQGSIVAVADSTGSAIHINGYDAWGIPNAANGGRFQYTGQVWLPELGMYHYKARLYSPTLGRFMQTDPIGYDDQVNLYAYVGNDPMNGIDPSGLAGCGTKIEGQDSAGCSGGTLVERIGQQAEKLSNAIAPTRVASYVISAATLGDYSADQIEKDLNEFLEEPLTNLTAVLAAFPGGKSFGAGVGLGKQLASTAQMREVGKVIAGAGSSTVFHGASKVAREYGGRAQDWVKKSSTSFKSRDGMRLETHWVENIKTGKRVEFKSIIGR